MLNAKNPDDFVIATGRTVSLEYFTQKAFENFGLNWRDYVSIDNNLLRPTDIIFGRADPSKAETVLGWSHKVDVDEVILLMCESQLLQANNDH
jgi:GDPmannose 4,6-dehydratase